MLTPVGQGSVRLHRSEFEAMIHPHVEETVSALHRAIASAGVGADQLTAVLLVGGSSRIPLVAQMVSEQLGRPVAVDADPKNAIAKGAALSLTPAGISATGAYAPAPRGHARRPVRRTGPLPWPRGAGAYAPVAEIPAGVSDSAAPFAIAFFGSASTATGRPSCSDTIWATSGIRDEPPTSSTAVSWSAPTPAEAMARRSALTVSSTCGWIIASNSLRCSRTDPCADRREHRDGHLGVGGERLLGLGALAPQAGHRRQHRRIVRVQPVERLRQPARRRARTPARRSRSRRAAPRPAGLPRRLKPCASLRTTAASNVPPPKSYTAIVEPGSTRSAAA